MMGSASTYSMTDGNGVVWDLGDGPVTLLSGAVGFGEPEEQEFITEAPLLDGQTHSGSRFRARNLMLPMMIDHSDPAVARQFWSGIRPGGGSSCTFSVLTIVESGGDIDPLTIGRTLLARHVSAGDQSLDIDPGIVGYEVVALDFVADDPYWKGPTVSKTFQTAQDDLDFYAPAGSDYVLWLASASTVDDATLTNEGSVDSWAVIRVDGPADSFWVDQFSGDTSHPVGGAVEVPDGYYLEIDTDPRRLSARLYAPEGWYTNVYRQMTSVTPFTVAAGTDVPVYIELIGEGSITISLEPRFTRAF